MRKTSRLVLPLALLTVAGCQPKGTTTDGNTPPVVPLRTTDRTGGAFAQTDPWLLTTTDPNAGRGNHGIFLGNGFWGVTIGASGEPGAGSVLYMAGRYDDRENLQNFAAQLPATNPASTSGEYSQTLDMRHGLLITKTPSVTTVCFVSAVAPGVIVIHREGVGAGGTETKPSVGGNSDISVSNQKDGSGTTTMLRIDDMAYLRAIHKEDTKPYPVPRPLPLPTYAQALAAHTAAWEARWRKADIQIEGDGEAQQLAHRLLFDLLQSTRPGSSDSIAPETLSGDFYKGHIFWDAEVWMFPALLAQHPDFARAILEYRFRHLPQAREQAKKQGCAGADFPWESAASGREVAPGGFSQGRHVTAGVGWAAWQYYRATGDTKWLRERGYPLLSGVADYWSTRAKLNAQTGQYDINGVYGPDELHGTASNNTYTNALARACLEAATRAAQVVGQPANPRWAQVAAKLALPFDKSHNRYLARQNDDGGKTKQADGELVLYPARLPMKDETARATFAFHAARPIQNGPAMTASIHALIAARFNQPAPAERYFRDSYRPFVRGPFLLFSEKRSLDRCVFATGAGGVLQSILYGFGGLDFDDWEGITRKPVCLPPTWKRLTITGIQHNGKTYTLTVTPQGRTLVAGK